jgi:CHAT domain-containing protein
MASPAWIPLCEEPQIQEILSRANGKNSNEQARILYDVFGSALYSTIWQPLKKELAGVKTVFYSPSGLLHKISFNAIPTEDGQRLADKYDLNLVSSTREVVHTAQNNSAPLRLNSSVVYGGLQYDEDAALMQSTARSYGKSSPEKSVSVASALPPSGTRGGGSWGPLPASRTESLQIHGYLNDKNIPAALYTDNLGNEESFKHLDGSKTNLIHLATHGFFLEDIEQNHDNRDLVERLGGGSKAVENPLLRSGLILAGGNHAWREEAVEGIEDGILTADEISRLNLTGTKLVVLSACQTGLGEVNNGEGVFGLQRAFKLAGVETLIMSLWEVDDAATSQLMATFYQQWLSGKTKQDSFKEAQRQVRAKYPSPYYWAAFVLMD